MSRGSLLWIARKTLGPITRYLQRIGRWAIVLWQVRGNTWRDEFRLVLSAAAAPVTALRNLSVWQDPVLLFDATVRVPGIGVFCVRRHTDDLWHILPWRERDIHYALRDLLRPGDVFIDAGANIGIYAVLASRLVGPTGKVMAIEMMSRTADVLQRHVAINNCSNVEIVERALSDRPGLTLTGRVPTGKHGQATIAQFSRSYGTFEEEEVRTTTLDELCRGFGHIALLKLDIEGAEERALAGARSMLQRTNRIIYESHTASEALASAVQQAGFRITLWLGKDRLAERESN